MRLYLKVTAAIVAAALIQWSLPSAAGCAREAHFAARCWLAHQRQDAKLEARLVEEWQERLVQDLSRAGAQLPMATVAASAPGPAIAGAAVDHPDAGSAEETCCDDEEADAAEARGFESGFVSNAASRWIGS